MPTTFDQATALVRAFLETERASVHPDFVGPLHANYLGGIAAALNELERAGQPLTAGQYVDLDSRIQRLEQLADTIADERRDNLR